MKTKTAQLLVSLLLIAIIVGGFMLYTDVAQQPPKTHQTIVNKISIKDMEPGYDCYLKPRFVYAKEIAYGQPTYGVFQTGETYMHSVWLWVRGDDAEWSMTIWGPGDDGATYSIEFGRLGSHPFKITVEDTEITVPKASGKGEGWYAIEIKLV